MTEFLSCVGAFVCGFAVGYVATASVIVFIETAFRWGRK